MNVSHGLSKLLWGKLGRFPALVCWHSQLLESQGRRGVGQKNRFNVGILIGEKH